MSVAFPYGLIEEKIDYVFKNKELIFWTFAFPIILGTLFYAAFSNIKTAEDYEPIKIAVLKKILAR